MSDPSNQAKAIFLEAIEKYVPEQWPAFLDEVCADDPPLRSRVEQLLKARSELGSFHEDSQSALQATIDQLPAERPGTMIGRFKLLEEIGEGGMGTVWMAQQSEPIKRLVAIKLIKPGMDSKQVLARFDAERQALALMDHPNIAKVFDAGTTGSESIESEPERQRASAATPRWRSGSDGRPYFVMELVKGVPITKYCDEHHLTPRQRLELFIPVCHAIQHAHQKGIIHRDIKPSNVLVAMYDDRPVPKVIDFGVAKATGQQLTEATLHTGFGAVVGTVEYMSPEQASFNQLDVDTRSDIYSLGVLLYELLAGSPPFTKRELEKAGMMEMLRVIREQEPSKPSTKLSSSDALPSLSANRGTEPSRLAKLVRGELDWIVMKALEKDRSRRYETANGFAMDVQRYLADEAVQACPPSAMYRFGKFARRNKRALVTATLLGGTLLAAVVLAVVVLAVSNAAITRERDEKAAALKQKTEAVEQKAEALVRTNEARVKAQRNAERAEANFQATLGVVDQMLGAPTAATRTMSREKQRIIQILNEKARQIFQELVDKKTGNAEERLQLAWTYVHLAKAESRLDERAKAIAAGRQAIALFEQLAADSPDVANHKLELVRCYSTLAARLERSPDLRVLSASIVGFLGSPLQQAPFLAASALIHGESQPGGPELVEAKQARSQALALCERSAVDFPNDPQYGLRLAEEYNRSAQQSRLGPQKVAAYRSVRAIYSKLATDFPANPQCQRWLALSCHQLAGVLPEGAPEAAELLQQELVIRQKLVADFHQPGDIRWLGDDYTRRGELLVKQGRPREAVEPFRQAAELLQQELVIRQQLVKDFHQSGDIRWLGAEYKRRGQLLVKQGRPREAVEPFRQAMVVYEQLPNPQKCLELDWAYRDLGHLLKDVGQPGEAEKIFRKAAELFGARLDSAKNWPQFHPDASLHYLWLGEILRKTDRLQEAEQAYRQGLAILAKLAALDEQIGLGMSWGPPENQPMHRMWLADRYVSLGQFFKDTAQPQKAEQAYQQAVDVRQKLAADCPTHPEFREKLARTYADLGKFLKDTGQPQKAGQAYGRGWEAWREAADLYQLLEKNWPWYIGEAGRLTGYDLGEGLEATDQIQEAEQAYQRVADVCQRLADKNPWNQRDPDAPRHRHNGALTLTRLGMLLSRQGKHTEAEKAYSRAIELNPKSAAAHYCLGNALHDQKKLDQAVASYRNAIELDPKHAHAHHNLGTALYNQKKLDEAITCYRKAIELDPKDAMAHTNLSNALAKKGWDLVNGPDPKLRDPKRAVELGKEAVEIAPKSTQALQYFGWIQYRAGNWKASIEALEQSCKLQPGGTGDAGQWFVLALAHAKLAAQEGMPEKEREHHKTEARRRYEQADKQIDSWWRVRPSHAMGQAIWDFRAEARELLGVKESKK